MGRKRLLQGQWTLGWTQQRQQESGAGEEQGGGGTGQCPALTFEIVAGVILFQLLAHFIKLGREH